METVPIEHYALIGDNHTAALVSQAGSVDWLCLPRFDSGACFAALLGDESHGRWALNPATTFTTTGRRYRPGTLVLETDLACATGLIRLIDFMPHRHGLPTMVRIVQGLDGVVPMSMLLSLRLDYGWVVPWVRRAPYGLNAVAGPDGLSLRTPVDLHGRGLETVASFEVAAGDRVPFVLTWHPSVHPAPWGLNAEQALADCTADWQQWVARGTYQGPYAEAVQRSLITLKALTYEPAGSIVAAPTTSLPEQPGGVRNWDYRFTWLRDAAFTLSALLSSGYQDEARAWREWLLRTVAGDPSQLQIMYGINGERRLPELTLDWLPGYQGSRPVRVGNAAARQFQLDVYGEVIDALHTAHHVGLHHDENAWSLQRRLLGFLEEHWRDPDEGIWEIRGPRQHFTYSKVMAWAAFDRASCAVTQWGMPGPAERWQKIADTIHADICTQAFDSRRGTFVQAYGSTELDASLLLLPLVSFLPPTDPRIVGTVEAIQNELTVDGLVQRYSTEPPSGEVPAGQTSADGLPPGEGSFLLCSFWLVDNLTLQGRLTEATALFERLLKLRNDVGLLSEEYDPATGRLLGNFPQAFSHVGLVNSALRLAAAAAPPAEPDPCGHHPLMFTPTVR